MFWIILVTGIVGYIIYKFLQDRNNMLQRQVDMQGGMAKKYEYLVKHLTDEPSSRVVKVTRDHIHIRATGQTSSTNFFITENFNLVVIKWVGQTDTLGIHKYEWSFNHMDPQEKMLKEIHEYMVLKAKQIFGNNKFEIIDSLAKEEDYSEQSIQIILNRDQKIIFNVVKDIKEYFALTEKEREYADEYLNYVCFIISGAILMAKLNSLDYNEDDDECKRVFRSVYYNSLNFCRKFIFTKHIELPMFHTLDEKYLILEIKVKLDDYINDIKHFLETEESCYIEKLDNVVGYEAYTNRIQYVFIQDTHGMKFYQTQNGISLESHSNHSYLEYGLEEVSDLTLDCIKTLNKRSMTV